MDSPGPGGEPTNAGTSSGSTPLPKAGPGASGSWVGTGKFAKLGPAGAAPAAKATSGRGRREPRPWTPRRVAAVAASVGVVMLAASNVLDARGGLPAGLADAEVLLSPGRTPIEVLAYPGGPVVGTLPNGASVIVVRAGRVCSGDGTVYHQIVLRGQHRFVRGEVEVSDPRAAYGRMAESIKGAFGKGAGAK